MVDPVAALDCWEKQLSLKQPTVGLILGSGMQNAVDDYQSVARLDFSALPQWPHSTVPGHRGQLQLMMWGELPILVSMGRFHLYEGYSPDQVELPITYFARWGVRSLFLTNAVGGIHPTLMPGDLTIIRDYHNFQTLAGWCDHQVFPGSDDRYVKAFSEHFFLSRYAAVTGPSYETVAEIRALACLGIDTVGMSTCWELLAAQRLGISVFALSCVTNKGAGLQGEALDHSTVQTQAQRAIPTIKSTIQKFLKLCYSQNS